MEAITDTIDNWNMFCAVHISDVYHDNQSCNFIQVIIGVLIGDIQCQFYDFSPKQPHLRNWF